jgi:membrane-bound lytic murein transglycosylase D
VTVVFLCALLALAGCTVAGQQSSPELAAKYSPDADEMMPIPYTPRDDGVPLSPDELYAFKTVGELDRSLTEEEARIVELHFKFFLHQRRASLERFILRSARFLPNVRKVFTARGIPGDISYLLMVESGGNPLARSPAGAVGLWQFMPFTGKKYGLYQSTWLDERRDPYKSTFAASDYLLKLYGDFSNWHLAVAAYNAGEGKIGRAVSGTGASGFFELCRLDGQLEESARLKAETRDYVPRLIAISKIMRNLDRLGLPQPRPDMAWDLAPMTVPPGTDLKGLASQMGFSWDEFKGMNPAYSRYASPPTSTSTAYVPPDRLSEAVRWAASNEARVYAGWREYTVRKGDSLASIAKRHQISVASLREANGIRNLPRRGSVLLIPGRRDAVRQAQYAPPERAVAAHSAGAARVRSGVSSRVHRVQKGETMFSLALQWGTDVASIRAANGMGPRDNALKIGQSLTIPANSKRVPAAPLKTTKSPPRSDARSVERPSQPLSQRVRSITVQKGDTLYSISKKYGVSVADICQLNNLNKKSMLRLGQRIALP